MDEMTVEAQEVWALVNRGELEEAEERGVAWRRKVPYDLSLILAHATGLVRQLAFPETIETALAVVSGEGGSISERLLAIRLICVAYTSLGYPNLARPFIEQTGLDDSQHCVDRCWRGRLLAQIGAMEEALEWYEKVDKVFPGHPFMRSFRGYARRALGDSAGFVDDLCASTRNFFRAYYPDTPYIDKMWEGEPLEGKTVAIAPLGGFGDYFQFIRFAPALRQMGVRRIVALANDQCHGLIKSAGVDQVEVFNVEAMESADLWTSIFGLERVRMFGVSQAVPGAYLAAPDSLKAQQLAVEIRQKANGRPVIGICWHSDAQNGECKSIPLHALLPLFGMNEVHWVVFQRGFGLRRLISTGLHYDMTLVGEDMTFDENAALLSALEGVVAIDCWLSHLSGALGVRTWLLLSKVMDARYENRERTSVLYPGTVTLARQPSNGDWNSAIRILMEDLRDWMKKRSDRDVTLTS